tara:strand:+ start:1666 stop:2142 length:477 start_codon:yes stop_codon:yes gene_type:complete
MNDEDEIIGFTCSSFDLLHAGHILMLREAKQVCDYLICGLQIDPTIDRPEKNKPVQSMMERYIQLQAVEYVDEIIPYETEQNLLDLLIHIPIHVRIIGEDYYGKDYTGKDLGIKMHYNKRQHQFSTTGLRQEVTTRENVTAFPRLVTEASEEETSEET